jgi:peptidylprolyl isomerase
MIKKIFVYIILVIFIGATFWLIFNKIKKSDLGASEDQKLSQILNLSQSQTSVSPTPLLQEKPNEPVRYDNGLIVQDLIVGNGKVAENGDTLVAHYIGKLENDKVFDESYSGGKPINFVLGSGQLIKGWELGLVGMKEGGKRVLIIPPELGYGATGIGDVIPPNATLFFQVELISVNKKN